MSTIILQLGQYVHLQKVCAIWGKMSWGKMSLGHFVLGHFVLGAKCPWGKMSPNLQFSMQIMKETKKSSYQSKSSVHEVPGPLSCGDNCSDFYRLLKLYRHFTAASAFQASDRFRAPPLRVTRCQICQRGCSSCDSPFSSRLHMWSITTVNIFFT